MEIKSLIDLLGLVSCKNDFTIASSVCPPEIATICCILTTSDGNEILVALDKRCIRFVNLRLWYICLAHRIMSGSKVDILTDVLSLREELLCLFFLFLAQILLESWLFCNTRFDIECFPCFRTRASQALK